MEEHLNSVESKEGEPKKYYWSTCYTFGTYSPNQGLSGDCESLEEAKMELKRAIEAETEACKKICKEDKEYNGLGFGVDGLITEISIDENGDEWGQRIWIASGSEMEEKIGDKKHNISKYNRYREEQYEKYRKQREEFENREKI